MRATGLEWGCRLLRDVGPRPYASTDVQSEAMLRVVGIGCRQILQGATARNKLRTCGDMVDDCWGGVLRLDLPTVDIHGDVGARA